MASQDDTQKGDEKAQLLASQEDTQKGDGKAQLQASQKDTQKGDGKAPLLAEVFQNEGLEVGYWLPKLSKILGVQCTEALQHLQYEDYLKLECQVRHSWEKKALQKLLKIPDNKATSEELQKQHLERTKQRQEVAKQVLNELTETPKSRSQSQDAVRQKAEAQWQAMEIPKEFQPAPKKPLADVLESNSKQLEQQESSVCRRENIPDTEVLRQASGGLALQGIYRTSRAEDVLAKREQLIRVPEGFQLIGPEKGSVLERKEFSSNAAESSFTKSMEQLGFTISASAKAEFWRVSLGLGVDYSRSSQSEDTHQSNSEQSYFCITKYQYIPLASCFFQRHQLLLSDAALQELQHVEQLLSFTREEDKPKLLESFFHRFGSHVDQGPLHFGGIFWWKAYTEGFRDEHQEKVKRQTSDALNSFVGASLGGFGASGGGASTVSISSSKASVEDQARESSLTDIQLYVVNTGGPSETDSLSQWKNGLVSNNSTWCVIDRGFQLIPVWEVILCNHSRDFQSVYGMSSALRAAYKALTNQSVDTTFREELASAVEEARDFMEFVKTWEGTVDERKLLMLMDLKEDLNAKTKNPSVWIEVCLSDKALQEVLVNTVRSCQESPPENSTSIKALLWSLLDPHINSVKNFPKSSFIMQWIFQTEHRLPKTPKAFEFEQLVETLQQMMEHIHAVTYTPGTSATAIQKAKIEATWSTICVIHSSLQSLQERAQKDMQLLVLLIATSTGYQVDSNTFQRLLGHEEIQYMAKAMEAAHEQYVNLKEQDADRAEASLLLTGLTVTPESQELSPEQKRERLVFMERHMKGLWSSGIKNLLQKHRECKDWEMLECDLYKTMLSGSKSKANQATANQEFFHLLKRLGLESHYPGKMGMGDFHIICKTSLHDRQPSKDQELPFHFLQKLLTVDYRVRYLTCREGSNPGLVPVPETTEQEHEASDSFENVVNDLEEAAPEAASREGHVHPMDLQMAIFHCADDFLRQSIATKLAFCQLALPLLVPKPGTAQIEFPLWALSQIKRSWKEAEKSGQQPRMNSYNNKLIHQAETPIVSFIRIGTSASFSKSQLLNALLSKQRHDTFFHRHCRGSTRESLLMEGVVEIAWYCPRGSPDDTFECCVAFCNLHGDARGHRAQLQFLQEISAVNVALVSESEHMYDRGKKLLRDLSQSQRPLVCLLTDKENVAAGQSSKNITIGIKNRNERVVLHELSKTIGNLLEGSNPRFSLDACLDKARQHGFLVDEDQPECVTAKAKAKELVTLLKKEKLSEINSKLLPQENLWHQWSQIESLKAEIRRKQLEQVFPLDQLMNPFLGFLLSQSADTKKYFLQWMKVFMDDLSSGYLEELRRDQHKLWSEIRARKKDQETPSELNALSEEIKDSSIGLEHLLREVGQIYEAKEVMSSRHENVVKLPQVAADLMVSGYPVELMDGDASCLPLHWVGAIFDSLIERLGDKRVFVLSVLGLQSTGKSTLLNAMFGLQFNVSAGRCTWGVFMQLLPLDEELQQDMGFDYMLVVDTKGLCAPDRASKQSLNNDNELATFVIGISNMTLINIFGENPSDMQDVLQITVQAFLRMKEVHLSPSCLFVHQNVREVTAKEQNLGGQRLFQEMLDEMTVAAAQQESCDISSFSDIIHFDVNTHVHYLAHLWEGNPPMAPPNPTYSHNVQQLKRKILQVAKKESQGRILRLSSLKVRIGDLWNAWLNENFFVFKNSLEIAVYRKLDTAFSQWTWRLRSHISEVQMRLGNRIRNGDLQQVTREHLEGLVQETSDAIMTDMEKYFREDKDREILVQWKSSTELKMKDLKESLLLETRKKCESLIELQKTQHKLDARSSEYEDELLRRSRELALTLKGKSLSERELRDNFTAVWDKWIAEVSCAAPPPEQVDIDVEIEDVLLEYFKEPGFYARIRSFPKHREFSLDLRKHVRKKNLFALLLLDLNDADVNNLQDITENIIQCVRANIDKKEQKKMDYSRNFIHEILNEVQKGVNSVPSNASCTFTRDYSLELSLYLCRMAGERFKAMHEEFRKDNYPVIYLSSKREDFFTHFQISCQGTTSVPTFATFLCQKIALSVFHPACQRTAKAIARDMQEKIPDFQGNRANLEVCILRFLAQEEKFKYFKEYLKHPKKFFQMYIALHFLRCCLDENRRLEKFLASSLDLLCGNILSAVSSSTEKVKDRNDREDKTSLWLDEFCRELTEVINLPRSELRCIEHQEITDLQLFNKTMEVALAAMRDWLKGKFVSADLSWFERLPLTIPAELFSGCWEQCPFCGAVCTYTMWGHDGDHQLVFHRPEFLAGRKWRGTDHLVIEICRNFASAVKFSSWKILPDPSMQAYWKWFVCRFRRDLETLYNGKFLGKGEIPEAWKRITKQEALAELDKCYATLMGRKNLHGFAV
ncbi:interferon-induced very large GTPase 1 [Manacus vitellinus]|uniref:interferon-induced very large GTPase 1 n=1 Tax=Manacus vitellinus TaxID=328815 RepID=UPI000846F79A|nr:interferon-induced very large GTPase 1 [Manacus vitellinus]